jgi:glutamyl-tRNA reductase
MTMDILVVGLNHTTAPVDVREKVTFPGDESGDLARRVANLDGMEEAVILSTCNRGEIVAVASSSEGTPERLVRAIGEIHDLDPAVFRKHLYFKTGSEAVRHLFRVASSLDSMVLGEPQILGQVKEGYRHAVDGGATGPIINRLLHRAFFTAKRVRHETGIGEAAVSVAYAAVELARKILGDLHKKRILLIGAGEIAVLASRHLAKLVEQPLIVTNRTYERACALAAELCSDAVPFEQLDECLEAADVVISSTAGTEPIIRKEPFKRVMRIRRHRPIFLIDIAIPRDVEPEVNDLDGVYLYNIDDLQAVVQENVGERKLESRRAENIVVEEVLKFMDWMRALDAAPTIVALKEKLERIREGELSRLNGKLSRLGSDEREVVEIITRAIVNKIAHDPIVFLKKAGVSAKRNVYLDATQRMFNLHRTENEDLNDKEDSSTE